MGDINFSLGKKNEDEAEKRDTYSRPREDNPNVIHMQPATFAHKFGPAQSGPGIGNA